MSRFNSFDNLVVRMMSRFGGTALYIKTSTIPNDATGGVDVTQVTIPINCIRQELIKPRDGSSSSMPNTSIQDGDVVLFVQPTEKADVFAESLSIDASSDKVIMNGITWKVVTAKQHGSDPSDVILYELYVRK